jgi:Golgi nucleoside diphosphatase
VADFSSYEGRIPVLLGVDANVVLLRIENQPPGLDHVLRYLSKTAKGDANEG